MRSRLAGRRAPRASRRAPGRPSALQGRLVGHRGRFAGAEGVSPGAEGVSPGAEGVLRAGAAAAWQLAAAPLSALSCRRGRLAAPAMAAPHVWWPVLAAGRPYIAAPADKPCSDGGRGFIPRYFKCGDGSAELDKERS